MEKKKILVVEDEAPIQELLQFNLERKKYRVKVVDSGEKALKAVGIEVFTGVSGKVGQAVEAYKKGSLEAATQPRGGPGKAV